MLSEASHIKASTPREPRAKPSRVRATSAGKDSAVAADARADALLFLRPFFDALPSPPTPLGGEEEEGPAGENSLLCTAARRMGERGEAGIAFFFYFFEGGLFARSFFVGPESPTDDGATRRASITISHFFRQRFFLLAATADGWT